MVLFQIDHVLVGTTISCFSLGINCVHEPPRRVLIELPNSSITLSDYLFPGEGPEDAKSSLEELLDIEIKGQLKIQDVEGQTGWQTN